MKKILVAPRFKVTEGLERAYTTNSFATIVQSNGCLPIMPMMSSRSTKKEFVRAAHQYITMSDGLILQGGNDIDPSTYGEKPQGAINCQLFRDVFEFALLTSALEKGIPILGICRGFQLVNVFFGGSLIQNLPMGAVIHSSYQDDEINDIQHRVKLITGSLLSSLYKKQTLLVNSYHHQGVKKLGKGLTIEAKAKDGLIEAVSSMTQKVLAVQWHPEIDVEKNEEYRKLFSFWFSWV
ncbi:gamma-glutamyl-gamma-aminobutyrate hydrolase family protein [Candidatus Roizmanbacteria bacterium]|nr:gamma-glutamyl-gamma-aminobutyrate hydrolase family protein [Candidatus Roizmanbacteria bacterium]